MQQFKRVFKLLEQYFESLEESNERMEQEELGDEEEISARKR